jgi:hypothetical protein
MEGLHRPVPQRPLKGRLPRGQRPAGEELPPQKPVGRLSSDPSTRVHGRLPLALVVQWDRFSIGLRGQTGRKANRGMLSRRALKLFLAAHASDDTLGGTV